jgi:large subunit ribosomal protein L6
MSRIGKYPVVLPKGVEVKIDGGVVRTKGKLGELALPLDRDIALKQEGDKLWVEPQGKHKRARMMWGSTRAHLRNMVEGVSKGYTVELEIAGVGYRAAVQGKNIQFQLGFSHDVILPIPEGMTVTVDKNTQIAVKGTDRGRLGQFCAEIRALRPPEPYKGKGIKYKNEAILRKEGKKK